MKIIYMYIQSYGSLRKRGFLFDAHYSVYVSKQDKKMIISIKENDEFIDQVLYGNMSVTAIVGDNGVGKSTCLDALQYWLIDSHNNPGIVIWEKDQKLFYQSTMTCDVQTNNMCEIKFRDLAEAPLPLNAFFFSDTLGERSIDLYETSTKDNHNRSVVNTYIDISTVGIINALENSRPNYISLHDIYKRDSLLQIRLADQLSIKEHQYPWEDIIGKKRLYFQHINFAFMKYKLGFSYYRGEKPKDTLSRILVWCRETESKFDVQQLLQETLFFDYLNALRKFMPKSYGPHTYDVPGIVDYLFSDYLKEGECNFFNAVFNNYNQESYIKKEKEILKEFPFGTSFTDFEKYVLLYRALMNNPWFIYGIENSISSHRKKLKSMKIADRTIPIDIPENESLQSLYTLYLDVRTSTDLLKFEWNMSSGENSIFQLFSRLYDAIINSQNQIEDEITYLIIIDEIDNLYHPRWQQKIVYWLSKFLNYTFPMCQFQLIITTHSPVLLSDIPESRVIFMQNNGSHENCISLKHDETFAANIATLYYDAFFMYEGSIGKVAQETLDMMYDVLAPELGNSVYVIPLTNEEIIKNKQELGKRLSTLLNKRFIFPEELKIGENEALPLLLHLINIIGEDIWREQLRASCNRYFVLKKTQRKPIHKIRDILERCSKTEREAILKEIMENDSYT